MANAITLLRILSGMILLFFRPFSAGFYAFYLTAGLSDILDGTVARMTGTQSETGARLDTASDMFFTAVCLVKLLPVLKPSALLLIWISVIGILKISSIVLSLSKKRGFPSVHSIPNRLTGLALFTLPLILPVIDFRYVMHAVCALATFAALHEGYIIINQTGPGSAE